MEPPLHTPRTRHAPRVAMCKVLVLALLVLRAAAGGQGACTNPDADEIERIMALAGFARPAIAVVQGSAVRADELVSMNVQDLIDLFGGDLAPMAVRGAPTDRAPGEVRSMEGYSTPRFGRPLLLPRRGSQRVDLVVPVAGSNVEGRAIRAEGGRGPHIIPRVERPQLRPGRR